MECTKMHTSHEYLVLEQESKTKHRTSHVGVLDNMNTEHFLLGNLLIY